MDLSRNLNDGGLHSWSLEKMKTPSREPMALKQAKERKRCAQKLRSRRNLEWR